MMVMKMHTKFLLERMEEINNSKDLGIDGRITLKWVFEKYELGIWIGCIWLRIRIGGGLM
jgi:hypothetical protein